MSPALRAMAWRGAALLLVAFVVGNGDRRNHLGWVILAVALGGVVCVLAVRRLARRPAGSTLALCCALAGVAAVPLLLLFPTSRIAIALAAVYGGGLLIWAAGSARPLASPRGPDHAGEAPSARPSAARALSRPPPPAATPPSPLLQRLAAVIHGDVPPADFERDVYASPEMEDDLGAADYHALLAFDYRGRDAPYELRKLLEAMYERRRPGLLVRDRVRVLAAGLCDGSADVESAVNELARYWHHPWMPGVFVSIDSYLGEIPTPDDYPLWNEDVAREKQAEWEAVRDTLRADAVDAVRKLLQALDASTPEDPVSVVSGDADRTPGDADA